MDNHKLKCIKELEAIPTLFHNTMTKPYSNLFTTRQYAHKLIQKSTLSQTLKTVILYYLDDIPKFRAYSLIQIILKTYPKSD